MGENGSRVLQGMIWWRFVNTLALNSLASIKMNGMLSVQVCKCALRNDADAKLLPLKNSRALLWWHVQNNFLFTYLLTQFERAIRKVFTVFFAFCSQQLSICFVRFCIRLFGIFFWEIDEYWPLGNFMLNLAANNNQMHSKLSMTCSWSNNKAHNSIWN